MKAAVRIGIGVLVLGIAAAPGRLDAQARFLPDLIPRPKVAEALSDDIGRPVVEELARRIGAGADAACLKSRNLGPASLQRHARDILVSYGSRLVALQSRRVTDETLSAEFEELAGIGAAAELRALARRKSIEKLQALHRPRLNDDVVGRITAAFDHYAVLHRIPIEKIYPVTLGKMDLIVAKRAVDAEKAAHEAFGAESDRRRLAELYVKLLDAYERVVISSPADATPNFYAFAGVEKRLRELCLRRTS